MQRATKTALEQTGQAKEAASISTPAEKRRRQWLEAIAGSEDATNAERISAIKALHAMDAGQQAAADAFSTWPRARIVAELDRLSAQQRG